MPKIYICRKVVIIFLKMCYFQTCSYFKILNQEGSNSQRNFNREPFVVEK